MDHELQIKISHFYHYSMNNIFYHEHEEDENMQDHHRNKEYLF